MIRAVLALLLIAAAVAAAVFVADNPGHVEIDWLGRQVEMPAGLLAGGIVLLCIAASLLALLLAALRRLPRNLRRRRTARRRRSGEANLTRGLVALAAGDAAEAARHARRAVAMLDGAPIPLLLAAEAATRQGDAAAARLSYTALLEQPESEFLGLRGLIAQALRTGDDAAALRLATRARELRPGALWLSETLLLLQARAGDWPAAQATLAATARRQKTASASLPRHRGVVLLELSRDAERSGDLRLAAKLAARARPLAAGLPAATVQHARLLLALGRRRAALRAIERAWRKTPHPALATLYLDSDPAAGPLARAAAVQRLAAQNPAALESHLAVAEAALAAQLWGEARRQLGLAMALPPPDTPASEPTRRLCRLMARLEEGEAGDIKAARGWLDRALAAPPDAAYLCSQCGGESAEWQSLCRHCGGFGTLAWGNPPAPRRAPAGDQVGVAAPLLVLPETSPGAPGEAADKRLPAPSAAPPRASGLASRPQ